MHSFKDYEGRDWNVIISIGDVKRVRSLLGVDLLNIGEGDPPLIMRLAADLVLFCDVLYCLCKPEADALKITDEQFARLLREPAIGQARDAFFKGIVDFFQNLGRTEIVSVVNQVELLVKTVIQTAQEKSEELDMEAIGKSLAGSLYTDSPESSESLPILSASAN